MKITLNGSTTWPKVEGYAGGNSPGGILSDMTISLIDGKELRYFRYVLAEEIVLPVARCGKCGKVISED